MSYRFELNGALATAEDLASTAFSSYGHFTAMQVRDGRVRGLDLHLKRLDAGTRRLFGAGIDSDQIRGYLRQAVAGGGALSARVYVFSRAMDWEHPTRPATPDFLIRTGPATVPDDTPLRVRSVRYERTLPEVKHFGAFGLNHHLREARFAGYDDALFVDAASRVSEATIWNIGFLEGGKIIWPEASMLAGITLQLLRKGLRHNNVPTETREIRLSDIGGFDAAFFTNSYSTGWPLASVDDTELKFDPKATELLNAAYETNPWDEI